METSTYLKQSAEVLVETKTFEIQHNKSDLLRQKATFEAEIAEIDKKLGLLK